MTEALEHPEEGLNLGAIRVLSVGRGFGCADGVARAFRTFGFCKIAGAFPAPAG